MKKLGKDILHEMEGIEGIGSDVGGYDELSMLRSRITQLEEELDNFRKEGNYGLFFALNRKQNELAQSLNGFVLELTSEGKEFERYIKLTATLKDTVEATNWLRINYLKMDEKEAAEAETKGVPLVEIMARENKKGK
jgi:hypothetical protein